MKNVKLKDVAEQIRGVTYGKSDVVKLSQDGFLPVLRANNITDNGLIFDDLVFVREEKISEKQKIKSGDIVIAASSGSIAVVGKAAQAKSDIEAGFGAFCKVVRPNQGVDPSYLGHFFMTPAYRTKMSSLAAGANINNLKNEHLDDLEIPLPSFEEQVRISSILDEANNARLRYLDAAQKTLDLLQALSAKAFRGEL